MNAINMIDGLDGLAGTQVLVSVTFFALVAFGAGDARMGTELLILGGAIAGFLVFNLRSPWLKRALVFLGDTGGLFLGLLLAWYSVRLAGGETAPLRPMTAVWIVAVPLLDMGAVMFRRMVQKKSPFHPDRQHLHYIFLDAGFSVNQVVFMMGALAVAMLGAGAGRRSPRRARVRDVRRLYRTSAGLREVAGHLPKGRGEARKESLSGAESS